MGTRISQLSELAVTGIADNILLALADSAGGTTYKATAANLAQAIGVRVVDTVAALEALTFTAGKVVYCIGNGGGFWLARSGNQSANITADTTGAVWRAPDSDATGASGAWQRVHDGDRYPITWAGAATSGTAAANATAINGLIAYLSGIGGGDAIVPIGTFSTNQIGMRDNCGLIGVDRENSVLTNADANSTSVIASNDNTTTILWGRVKNLRISKPNATGGAVVDLTSWQFFDVQDNWITSKSVLGTECIRMRGLFTAGPVFTTEGTYCRVSGNYMGLTAFGIRVGPNANSVRIYQNRVQPSVTNGFGFYFGTTGAGETAQAGYPNEVTLRENSVEFPGGAGVSNVRGVFLEAVCDTIAIRDMRFEGGALSDGLVVTSGATGYTIDKSLYASSLTGTKIVNGSAGFQVL